MEEPMLLLNALKLLLSAVFVDDAKEADERPDWKLFPELLLLLEDDEEREGSRGL